MIRVLFVCLGNICRSPLAEGVFKKLVLDRGLDGQISADSAGTSGWHVGDAPDPRSQAVAENHGIQLEHLGRQFGRHDFKHFDYIVVMDQMNYSDVGLVHGAQKFGADKLLLMRDFDDLGKGEDVPDPYHGGPDDFEFVYQILLRSCQNLLEHIIKENKL